MKAFLASVFFVANFTHPSWSASVACSSPEEFDAIEMVTLEGKATRLSNYRGKVLLVVNVASECGFTPQYEGLEALHRKYAGRGLKILGFPCNQFGGQEPGDAKAIRYFCQSKYKVSFDLFQKTDVNGENAHPLFKCLTQRAPGVLGSQAIKWNFTKFLVSRDRKSVDRFGSNTEPSELTSKIEAWLKGVAQ